MRFLEVLRHFILYLLLTSFLLFLCACTATSPKTTSATDSPAPDLTFLTPAAVPAGSPTFWLIASGTGFQSNSVVMWNGTALTTTYTNSSRLNAQIPVSNLQSPGSATITVTTPAPGGGTSTGATFTIQAPSNPVPSLTSITPNTVPAGSPATTITATGSNFLASSTIVWNGGALTTSYTNSTTLTAQVPASDLTTAGTVPVTIANPTPGGGSSNAVNFTIGTGAQVITTLANDLAWDPVNQVIYLSLPSTDGASGNTVQILDPTTVALGASVPAGSEPNLLSVSATSQFLYVSQLGSSTVQVMTLPDLGSSSTIQLGSDSFYGALYAMDLQGAPNADATVAVVRGTAHSSPAEEGGVLIYDSGTARTNVICGWMETGCPNPNHYLMDSIQWKSDGSEIFAANNESSTYNFYTAQVDASGFGTVADYPGLAFGYFNAIHYDAATGYVYDDNGDVLDPGTGTKVSSFSASGLMVPDGATLGAAFFLGQTSQDLGTMNYTLESFNINTFVPIDSFTITNVIGTPTHLIRWGANGLAFTTIDNSQSPPTGAVYLVNGSLVGVSSKRTASHIENVQRTWKQLDPLHCVQSARDETKPTR